MRNITKTLIPSAARAYAAGDVIGTKLSFGRVNGELRSLSVVDASNQGPVGNVIFFDGDPGAVAADNIAFAFPAESAAKVLGYVTTPTYITVASHKLSEQLSAGLALKSQNLFAVFVGTGTPTFPGTLQVETATVAGTIGAAGAGNVSVVVTAANMTNSPKTIAVAVANNDTASAVAGKIRTALTADVDVAALFTVSGAAEAVILTAISGAANDTTLNIATSTGTAVGLTAAPTSVNTTAGVASAAVSIDVGIQE